MGHAKRIRKLRTDRRALGSAIRAMRVGAGITTQHKLASLLGVWQSAVSQWETGINEPSLDNLRAIARLCKGDLGKLVAVAK